MLNTHFVITLIPININIALTLIFLLLSCRTDGGHNCVGSSKSYRICNSQVVLSYNLSLS